MKSTEHWLIHEHTQFEVLMGHCVQAAEIADWWALKHYYLSMQEQLQYHMAQEEEVLFPAYDAVVEPGFMSTKELYNEHSVIVDYFRRLLVCINDQNQEETLQCLNDLSEILAEHNEKEEQVFLPFASRLLFEKRDELAKQLDEFEINESSRKWIVN